MGTSRFVRGLAAGAVAASAALAVAGVAGAAETSEPSTATLPDVGETYRLDAASEGMEITAALGTATTVALEGSIAFEVVGVVDDPLETAVEVAVTEFTLSAESETGVSITVAAEIDAETTSVLRVSDSDPSTLEHRLSVDLAVEVSYTSGDTTAEAVESSTLHSEGSAELRAEFTQFPPAGDVYSLQNPVELVNAEDPNGPGATLQKFPVAVG